MTFRPDPELTERAEPTEGRKLSDLVLTAVSLVDAGANEAGFTLIMRRKPEAPVTDIDKGKKPNKTEEIQLAELTAEQSAGIGLLEALAAKESEALAAFRADGNVSALKDALTAAQASRDKALGLLGDVAPPAPDAPPEADDEPPAEPPLMMSAKAIATIAAIAAKVVDARLAKAAPAPVKRDGEQPPAPPPAADPLADIRAEFRAELDALRDAMAADRQNDFAAQVDAELDAFLAACEDDETALDNFLADGMSPADLDQLADELAVTE